MRSVVHLRFVEQWYRCVLLSQPGSLSRIAHTVVHVRWTLLSASRDRSDRNGPHFALSELELGQVFPQQQKQPQCSFQTSDSPGNTTKYIMGAWQTQVDCP